jgi:hypothetical protein
MFYLFDIKVFKIIISKPRKYINQFTAFCNPVVRASRNSWVLTYVEGSGFELE